jgi:hypothetical protein
MIPPVIRDASIQPQGLNTSGTAASAPTVPTSEKHVVLKQPVMSPEASTVFSEEAKHKFEKDIQTLKFVRKVQALGEDTTRQARVEFKTAEGLSSYLNNLDTDSIAKSLINHNVL